MPTDEQLRAFEVKVRDLFDTANRVMFAYYLRDHALDPDIALQSSERVREVWFKEAEKTWNSVREECEFRTNEELDETLAMFKEKEAGLNATKTLLDHLQQGGLYVDHALNPYEANIKLESVDSSPPRDLDPGNRSIRPLTEQLILAAHLDSWPGRAAIVDFGIDSDRHLGALQFAVLNELVTPQELDAAMGSGAKLTEIAQRGGNPYRDVTFRTSWDEMSLEPPERDSRDIDLDR